MHSETKVMDIKLPEIKELIKKDELDEAIEKLKQYIVLHPECNDEPYYLLGNAYRKTGNWQQALNHYMEAISRNPDSPAVTAKKMLMDILEFYNKDMYNQ